MRNPKAQSNSLSQIFLGKEENNLKELNLIEIQKESWEKLLDKEVRDILQEFFPIEDYTGKKFALYFEDLYYDKPRYTIDLCFKKKLTYDFPVYVKVRLVNKKQEQKKGKMYTSLTCQK